MEVSSVMAKKWHLPVMFICLFSWKELTCGKQGLPVS
jgi:hypothetical protein